MTRNTYCLTGLRRLYAEKLGRGGSKADLAHIRAVVRMISPDEDFRAIKAVRPHTNRKGQSGAVWLRAALAVMRTADTPMTAREIALRVLEARGEAVTPEALATVQCSLLVTLKRRVGIGVVQHPGYPRRWSLWSAT